ncbi:MAG: hypothetical protein NZM25_06245 [Leptospiraceae bacterium]|nr:hypothetical protein [Leptospiraceae bacterium]MDW8306624.1 hypothetical protein [Leptospiraceae bacterium]
MRTHLTYFILTFFLLIFVIYPRTIELLHSSEAEYMTISQTEEGILVFQGGIILKIEDQILRAQTVKINTQTQEIFGEGQVILERGSEKIRGEKFIYDQKKGSGIIYNGTGELEGRYFNGREIKFSDKKAYTLKDTMFTTCTLKNPHFSFEASKVYFTEEREFYAQNVIIKVGKTRVFYLPFLVQTNFGTGIVTQYGNNISKGHFLQNTYFLSFPTFPTDSLLPQKGEIMFDWYQRGGIYGGVRLERSQIPLRYDLDVGVAEYKQLDTLSDIGGELVFTNQVRQSDGSRREVSEFWWKMKSDLSLELKRSQNQDRWRNLTVRFEHYRHKNFMQEFGFRFLPTNTFDALFRNRFFQGRAGYENISWEAQYTENLKNHSFSVRVERRLRWYERTQNADSKYLPVYDLQPRLSYSGNFSLVDPQGSLFGGLWQNLQLNSYLQRYYADGRELKTTYSADGNSALQSFLYLSPLLTYNPVLGYGFQAMRAQPQEQGLQIEARRQSFQYIFSRNTLRLGLPLFYHQSVHEIHYFFAEGVRDPTFGPFRRHNWEGSLHADFLHLAQTQLSIGYDLRPYAYPLPPRFRWSDLVWRSSMEYDLVQGFRLGDYGVKPRKYRHFASLGLVNTYSYLTRFARPHYNDFSISAKLGGYKLPILKELLLLEINFGWHENYLNLRQSNLHLQWAAELLLHPFWKLYLGGNSRAEQMERYRRDHPRYTPFAEDVIQSLNFFEPTKRREALFFVENFYLDLEHDLHDWLLRFSYTTRQRTVYYGPQLRNRLGFYEHTFFFSMTLKAFPGFGIPRTELYRENPTDMPLN